MAQLHSLWATREAAFCAFAKGAKLEVFRLADGRVQSLGLVFGEVTAIGGAQSTALVVCDESDLFWLSDQGATKRRVDERIYACGETRNGRTVLGGSLGKLLWGEGAEFGLVKDGLNEHGISKPGRPIQGLYSHGDDLLILGANSLLVEVRGEQWRELLAPRKSSEQQYRLFYAAMSQDTLYVAGRYGTEPFVGRVESGEIAMLPLPELLEAAPILSVLGDELFLFGATAAWRWSEAQWQLASERGKSCFVGAIQWGADLLAGRSNGALVRIGSQSSSPVKIAGWPI